MTGVQDPSPQELLWVRASVPVSPRSERRCRGTPRASCITRLFRVLVPTAGCRFRRASAGKECGAKVRKTPLLGRAPLPVRRGAPRSSYTLSPTP